MWVFLLQELNVQRIAKGAKADTLELLQFMHKLLTSKLMYSGHPFIPRPGLCTRLGAT
jgi:hypothetical protein